MIDIKGLLAYFWRYKWLIVSIPIICVGITFYLVKDLPQKYKSTAQLATGITDRFKEIVSGGQLDYFRANQQFGNITELMQSKRVMDILSYRLILHDLHHDEPFTPIPEAFEDLSSIHRNEVVSQYETMFAKREVITPRANGKYPLFDFLKSMGYDEKTLADNLFIYRNGESDFINIEFTSENPDLSAFVVNTFASEFISYYDMSSAVNQDKSIALLDSVLREKQERMNERNSQLEQYKSSRGALNLGNQSEVLFQQISDQENKRSNVLSEIQSLRGALQSIENKLQREATASGPPVSSENNEVVRLGQELEIANRRYVDNGFNEVDKERVDSLQRLRSAKIAQLANNPRVTGGQSIREDLLRERQTMEIALSRAESSMSSIESELNSLRSKYYSMVPADASVQNYEREADFAVKEYTDALNRFNQAKFENVAAIQLRIAEPGFIGSPEPSKTLLFLILSGVASTGILLTTLFILFLTDQTITDPKRLAELTGIPVLGSINLLSENNKDLRDIWDEADNRQDFAIYRNLLRALRFEINEQLLNKQGKVLGITSLNNSDGKTFLAAGLAYSFAMIGKKVLLIGENCPNLTELITNKQATAQQGFETFVIKKEIVAEDLITILNRNPSNSSLLEIKDATSITNAFEVLKQEFDLIITDIDNLKDINQVKEWLMFADKSVAVFASGNKLSDRDQQFLQYFKHHPSKLGWVMNKVSLAVT